MERPKEEQEHRKSVPRVPIQTYRWEDIRRARRRGGYPWTYLNRDPFDEEIHPSEFEMEAMPKSKSSSMLGKSSEGVLIQEVTNGVEGGEGRESVTPEPSGYIIITEVPGDSDNHSKDIPRGSLTIEEEKSDVEEPEILNLELDSVGSSENISQYLDDDEPVPEPTIAPEPKKEDTVERKERAKSEEPKRKRKLSIDSSYSRKSLSKLGFIKKLREAKEKIKIPKFNLKRDSSQKSDKETEKPPKTPVKKQEDTKPKKNEKPVYIHIPLKPPEGQTDEFSYLEFEEKKPPSEKKPEEPEVVEKSTPVEEAKSSEEATLAPEIDPGSDRRFSGHPDEIVAIEILKSESIDLDEVKKNGINVDAHVEGGIIIVKPDDSHDDDMIIIMPGSEEPGPSKSEEKSMKRQKSTRQSVKKERAKSAEPERKRKLSIDSSYSRISLSKLGLLKKLRDAKDKFKFPKLSLSRSGSKKEKPKKATEEETAPKEVAPVKKSKSTEPQIIHIPLKPPPGQTDEFSYLEFEEKKPAEPAKPSEPVKEEQSSIESPTSVQGDNVQFIYLTPPSDDEILDDNVEIPETPSSDSSKFFVTKIDELKELAKDVVDKKLSPEAKRKQLQSVREENGNDKVQIEEIEAPEVKADEPVELVEEKIERMVVDEEDGLKVSESAMAKQEQNIKAKDVTEQPQELKSSLKGGEGLLVTKSEGSPVLKKKVSFKRRSRDESKDGVYEDIQVAAEKKPTDETKSDSGKLAVLGASQSMSVDEEKTYLDEKIIKSTSLEEDYNRWSKLSDHEYEPVNPPPGNASPQAPLPTVNVVDTARPVSEASSTTSLERRMLGGDAEPHTAEPFTVQDMQAEIEDRFFNKAPVSGPEPTLDTSALEAQIEKDEPAKSEGKFQKAIKVQAGKFREKLHGIKKPNIKLPARPKIEKPNLKRFKFEKPKFTLPKIPDTAKINLPSFSLPRRNVTKRTLKERQLSTESNAGDSKKNYFDFRTYPRIFKKKPKDDLDNLDSKNEPEAPVFATVPRTKRTKGQSDKWGGHDTIRIPLHAEESLDKNGQEDLEDNGREDSLERRIASHMRYDQDIDIDDAYEKENQEIHRASPFSHDYNNSRWNHGSFHPEPNMEFSEAPPRSQQVTDLDSPGDAPNDSFDTNNSKDMHSSVSSLGNHRRGVLEEIDSDEFFLREKGISQDNIEMGMYLRSEIREAFKTPKNALADLDRDPRDRSYEVRGSNQSLPETQTKSRKPIKKPKRKKTPHVSQEQISFDQDSEQELEEIPPPRPKRRSKRGRKQVESEHIIPYQETIPVDTSDVSPEVPTTLGKLYGRPDYSIMYENEQMQGKEQPEIHIVDPYADFKYDDQYDSEGEGYHDDTQKPAAPPRKHRSLKSLNFSEHDSILGEFSNQNVEVYQTEHEYIIPKAEERPSKPPRTLSRSSSRSHDIEAEEPPIKPTRSRSQTQSLSENVEQPCVEEPCVQDFRDYMGYAVIDKNLKREPPLPPPRTPPRRKRSLQSLQSTTSEQKFFTVPRQQTNGEMPVRPLRNYSTLGPSRPPRRKAPPNMTDEEKENIDITQYIEIEDEPNRDLHSGEVIQKMRDRPLPAPPRPPRKTRALHDITSQENIAMTSDDALNKAELEETEVSTQTSPLPDDFVCEELIQEEGDMVITPSQPRPEQPSTTIVERRLITPTHYTHEETITHGSLIVEPLNGARILPDSELTRPTERIVPMTREYDDETSEIPEEFTKLKDPTPQAQSTPQVIERIIERPVSVLPDSQTEIEILRAQKLQVSDLDVDRLSVNELLASRIVVSEIDSGTIQVNDISSKTGALKIGELELPPGVLQQLLEKLQSVAQEQQQESTDQKPETPETQKDENDDAGQKKTPFEQVIEETPLPQRPPRKDPPIHLDITEEIHVVNEPLAQTDSLVEVQRDEEIKSPPTPPARSEASMLMGEETPQRPPRHSERPRTDDSDEPQGRFVEPDVDDEPPPRPPQPQVDYIPSQPPASFYALRAQQYVDGVEGDIPAVPRRRRHHKTPISRSSSDDSPAPPLSRRRFRSPEPTIPQLTSQLISACGTAANSTIKRLITHITNNVLRNSDGQQDLHVMMVILLVLIAGLILLGYGDGKTVHYHHWEYFNPPRDL